MGGPYADKSAQRLQAAGLQTPVQLNLQWNPDHYGPSSGDEYALIKDQLEATGLFTVNLQSTEYVQYVKDRTADVYPEYQLGWFPDYPDADNYLTPFFRTENFLGNHYVNPQVDSLISQQVGTAAPAARQALIEQLQQLEAQDLSTVPYLQGSQVAVTGADEQGTQDTLDASFKFRYGALSKGCSGADRHPGPGVLATRERLGARERAAPITGADLIPAAACRLFLTMRRASRGADTAGHP